MKIKAVKLFENGFMTQPFAFGGEKGAENFDASVKYRSSLQNYVIDTGDEVILVDTGLPSELPEQPRDDNAPIWSGDKIKDYVPALKEAGYDIEDITKILVTHKHLDHTGELKKFPNAEIFMSKTEAGEVDLESDNIIGVDFDDGEYYNFKKSQKIANGVYLIEAKGHTLGNSMVIVECDDVFYMLHGDITYTDEALYENKLSIVFEDIGAARETLDNVREFIKNNKTVYLSTHTPLGYENLENNKIIDLENPPESIYPN
ncbi:MAG: MBL fold metallo-hydrolase [archaeon]|uniref:Glyoxylase-like metal-dependent hydrolase (Beta-lactamase superfamily II) n=1 Tax=Methanobrevibacter gottschalkii DSM 11977 TaxID=1122229 RepID=A0A3N5AZ11_9EURY|nr:MULTISPECIES: MBL fold metallo-hydrolase [Methanobrevibacter]MCQ2970378.1 MBL fold metallo-hydrolase [archaeon]OEC94479.1 MBL fold metallo-hydrolase [Methanobrevibacter sp. A27]RPF50183.1 glyoxylase-like metal-dependent hydrolase (beta-lactamase superfamily II) [Methanobrevibacter gottschalkii DSM 11977]